VNWVGLKKGVLPDGQGVVLGYLLPFGYYGFCIRLVVGKCVIYVREFDEIFVHTICQWLSNK